MQEKRPAKDAVRMQNTNTFGKSLYVRKIRKVLCQICTLYVCVCCQHDLEQALFQNMYTFVQYVCKISRSSLLKRPGISSRKYV